MLRRQMHRDWRRPFDRDDTKVTAASGEAVSTLEELAEGSFQTVIGETDKIVAKNVKRVVVCSGKVYYELLARIVANRTSKMSRSSASNSSIRSRTTISRRSSRNSRTHTKSSGARKSRRTRAPGIA